MRLGILGGTFNPIHLGHLLLAECAREQCDLDQVWFIPTATPPHKTSRDLLPGAQRLALVRLAIRGHPSFRASDLEVRLGGISYTLKTVRLIRARVPRAHLVLIVGSDMLQVRWHGLSELSRLCTFAAAPRWFNLTHHPSNHPESRRRTNTGRSPGFPRMRRIVMPQVEISSSMIRARVRRGRSLQYLVPEAVARSITRHRFFQEGEMA